MKNFFILAFITGYTALVPVCFLSAQTISSSHGMETSDSIVQMTEHKSSENNCSADLHCTTNGPSHEVSHHMDMYSTFSKFAQTQNLLSLVMIVSVFMPTIFFSLLFTFLFTRLSAKFLFYLKKKNEIASIFKSHFLKWLSIHTNSPAYCLVI